MEVCKSIAHYNSGRNAPDGTTACDENIGIDDRVRVRSLDSTRADIRLLAEGLNVLLGETVGHAGDSRLG